MKTVADTFSFAPTPFLSHASEFQMQKVAAMNFAQPIYLGQKPSRKIRPVFASSTTRTWHPIPLWWE
ncbi:MAG TPA: hypothetical protein VFE47_05495 [Tepidisphaeraceae bacterium]|nr:hypothetical protein [Tepidisphaeraceae bacterium]